LKFFLFPFSFIYATIVSIRNKFFDFGILRVNRLNSKSICVGNLSVGGTGKTPMTIYLTNLLKNHYSISIVSRGYKRLTKGLLKVDDKTKYQECGDEPKLYKNLFKNEISVYVSEKRMLAVNQIEKKNSSENIILFDDAFQHRYIHSGLNILMTNFDKLFVDDFVLPMGSLREPRVGAKRSHIIVVNKCPNEIDFSHKNQVISKLKPFCKNIFFSRYAMKDPVPFGLVKTMSSNILVVTGIANPTYLHIHLKKSHKIEILKFKDHHAFSEYDIQMIHEKIDNFAGDWSIVTTQKDFMRMKDNIDNWKIKNFPWFYIPIELQIEDENSFNEMIRKYVRKI
jgi:tetraacyldisaccharide 4'-kinase